MESAYPYAPSDQGAPAYHAGLPFYDPYAALAFIAARTVRIKLCVSLSIVPLHDPYHLARSVMTLDLLSDGRFLFGIGAGWLEEEFDILGVSFGDRGPRLDEALDLLEVLWTKREPEFHGRFFELPRSMMEPKPRSQPHPPYVFGGTTKRALRRTAERGDGWYGVGVDVAATSIHVEHIRSLRREGMPPVEITVGVAPDVELDEQLVAGYAEAGVDRLVIRPWRKGRDAVPALQGVATRFGLLGVAPPVKDLMYPRHGPPGTATARSLTDLP
jgi:probable F420-dependent oxidoreductase